MGDKIEQRLKEEKVIRYSEFNEQDEYCKKHNTPKGSGGEYIAYLKLLCGLKPGDNLLDMGCGCGLMCLPINENTTLQDYIYPGNYYGLDIDEMPS